MNPVIAKDIEDAIVNDIKNGNLTIKEIAKKYNYCEKTILNIKRRNNLPVRFKKNRTKITKEEELLICNDACIKLYTLKEIAKKYNCDAKTISNIKKRNKLPLTPHGKLKVNENYFENIDTPDKAYFLGLFIADGCITKHPQIFLGLEYKDIAIIETFKQCLESEHKICIIEQERNGTITHMADFRFVSRKMRDDLEKIGITSNKSIECRLPILSNDLMPHLIRGLMDGDGWWHIRYREKKTKIGVESSWGLCSSVKSFLEELQNFLIETLQFSITKIIQASGTSKCWRLIYGGNQQCKKLYDYLYNCGGPRLERKYKFASEYFQNINFPNSPEPFNLNKYINSFTNV